MLRIPVVTKDSQLTNLIQITIKNSKLPIKPIFLNKVDRVIECLKYELPEIKILDTSLGSTFDPDAQAILAAIREDPWLHYGGIIAIHKSNDKELLEQLRDSNVIAVISYQEFTNNVERLLRILAQNRQFFFQRGIQQHLMRTISGTFIIDNDPLDIIVYTNLITNYLYNANLINRDNKEKLHVALQELLVNAIEHGNCKISFEEKSAWLESGKNMMELIREKNKDPSIAAKKVRLSYTIGPEASRFTITDEGDGFDWRARLSSQPSIGLHGMGIRMSLIYVEDLQYNEKGNEVSFRISHQKDESNEVPGIFTNQEEVHFKPGEIVMREGDSSDYLYYIVSGRYLVYSQNRCVSYLTPDDMFIGEMSFLLSNQRTATVVAKDGGTCIKVSKEDFVDLIKKNPHYGIFLARLLAQRLSRLNARTSRLNAEYLKLKEKYEKQTN
ncbi:MAG TPA: cyclic nucleotide-binding domain-containing protein [Termitinemataceae bacterium]|nr:cyclic nucleotide-binding domain-containing protein [Termitinemataceae bacterium]HOM22223.1 cyclic nucleotide-binding domain-containing protein [Termitinemataceae bacterium]HPP99355.1 cyclic nucleotide-binding domain-containing protein [Termitinemataceae bacterium]